MDLHPIFKEEYARSPLAYSLLLQENVDISF
jgi:hypothetical protein